MSHPTTAEPPTGTKRRDFSGVTAERELAGVPTFVPPPKPIPPTSTKNMFLLGRRAFFDAPESSQSQNGQLRMLENNMELSFYSDATPATTNVSVPDSRSLKDSSSSASMPLSASHSKSESVTSSEEGGSYSRRSAPFPVLPSTSLPSRGRSTLRLPWLSNHPAATAKARDTRLPPDSGGALSLSSAGSESTSESSEEEDDDDEEEEEGGKRDARDKQQALYGGVWTKELGDIWRKLQDQRRVVEKLRDEMVSKRATIRHLRRQKDEADNAFMQIVRSRLATNAQPAQAASISDDVLGRRFAEMQATRDEYHSVESEYENMELKLDDEEREFKILEPHFFSLLFRAVGGERREPEPEQSSSEDGSDSDGDGDDDDDDDDKSVSSSPTSLLGISGDLPVDIHPMYSRLLDAIGDRDLAKEYHTELLMHRDAILCDLEMKLKVERVRDEQGRSRYTAMTEAELQSLKASIARLPANVDEFKKRSGIHIRNADLEFLQEFEHEESEARKKLEEITQRVDRLRSLCEEKKYMRKNAPYTEEYAIFPERREQGFGSVNMNSPQDAPREDLSHPKFPILLSNPTHVLEIVTTRAALRLATKLPMNDPKRAIKVGDAMKEYGIATLFEQVDPENKSDFINRWLLHRLRTSPHEAELLFSIFSSVLRTVNLRRWQEDVLYHWAKDDAARTSPKTFNGPRTPNDDALEIGDRSVSSLYNSAIEGQARRASDPGASPTAHHWRGSPERTAKSVA